MRVISGKEGGIMGMYIRGVLGKWFGFDLHVMFFVIIFIIYTSFFCFFNNKVIFNLVRQPVSVYIVNLFIF